MNSTSRSARLVRIAGEIARLLEHRARRGAHRRRPARCRSRRRASSCRGRAGRRAARDRALRRAGAPPQSTPAGSRGRGPGRCSRRARAGAGPPRTARPRRRAARRSTSAIVSHRDSTLRQLAQRLPQRLLEVAARPSRVERGVDRLLGKRPMIAQVHQRREHVVAQRRRRARVAPRPPAHVGTCGRRSFSSSTIRSAVFLPTPGIAVSRATSPRSMARISSRGSMPESTASASFGPMPLIADQPLEQILLERLANPKSAAHPRARACGCAARPRRPVSPSP